MCNQLERYGEEYESKVRPADDFKVETIEEADVSIDSRRLTDFWAIAASRIVVIRVAINKSIIWYWISTAKSFAAEWCCWVIAERKRDDWKTLVLAIDT